jgi:hypothetical protein
MRNFLRQVRCEVRARPLPHHSTMSSLPNARSRAALLGAGYPNLKRHKDVDRPVAAFLVELLSSQVNITEVLSLYSCTQAQIELCRVR